MMNYFEHADWIFAENDSGQVCNSYYDYRMEVEIRSTKDVRLFLSASTLYALSVNGSFVECGQYPGYEDYQVYDEITLDEYLTEGENIIEITQYVIGENFSTHRIQIPGVIFAVWQGDCCLLCSSEKILSRQNLHYRSGAMEKVSSQLGYVFKYDACAKELPFQKSVLAGKEKCLYERPIRKLVIEEETIGMLKTQGVFLTRDKTQPIGKVMQEAYLSARTKKELLTRSESSLEWHISEDDMADGVYFVLDAGQETVGFLNLDFEVPQECEVFIGYGEHLEDMRVRTYIGNRNFCVSYHAHAGRNQYFNPFLRLGMRYMMIFISCKSGAIYQAGIRHTYYPLDRKEMLIPSPLHRKIYDVGVRTLQLCMHEHYEDCPWREQALYSFDSRVQMLCGYYAFGEFDFAKASLRLMALSLREDSMLELCSPAKVSITIPSFTAVFVRQLKEYLDYSGDAAFIQEMFPCAKKIAEGFERRLDCMGLIPCYQGKEYWNFYEWRDGLEGAEYFDEATIYECPLNAMVSDAFWCFARLCDVVCPDLASHYDVLHEKLNATIHETFFDSKRKVYLTRLHAENQSLHVFTQVLALYAGVTPENERDAVLENMLHLDMIPCSLSASIYKYDVLLQNGEQYRDVVLKEIEEIWGNMLYSGATTFWETDEGASDFHDAGSLCHGWSAVPIYLYGKYHLITKD